MSRKEDDFRRTSTPRDGMPMLSTRALRGGRWAIDGKQISREKGVVAFRDALKRGRPKLAARREMVSLRLEPDVVAALRATGRGWQTRVNALLREAVLKKRV